MQYDASAADCGLPQVASSQISMGSGEMVSQTGLVSVLSGSLRSACESTDQRHNILVGAQRCWPAVPVGPPEVCPGDCGRVSPRSEVDPLQELASVLQGLCCRQCRGVCIHSWASRAARLMSPCLSELSLPTSCCHSLQHSSSDIHTPRA